MIGDEVSEVVEETLSSQRNPRPTVPLPHSQSDNSSALLSFPRTMPVMPITLLPSMSKRSINVQRCTVLYSQHDKTVVQNETLMLV